MSSSAFGCGSRLNYACACRFMDRDPPAAITDPTRPDACAWLPRLASDVRSASSPPLCPCLRPSIACTTYASSFMGAWRHQSWGHGIIGHMAHPDAR
eukprot:1505521-Prymnesium_polylepis.1